MIAKRRPKSNSIVSPVRSARKQMVESLRSPDPETLDNALAALEKMGKRGMGERSFELAVQVMPFYLRRIEKGFATDPACIIANIVARSGHPMAERTLKNWALTLPGKNRFFYIRLNSYIGLGQIAEKTRNPQTKRRIAKFLMDSYERELGGVPVTNNREAIIQQLSLLEDERAMPIFEKGVQDENQEVRETAKRALAKLQKERGGS